MTPINFAYWLQGFFEISNANTMSKEQVQIVRNHLDMCFVHVAGQTEESQTTDKTKARRDSNLEVLC